MRVVFISLALTMLCFSIVRCTPITTSTPLFKTHDNFTKLSNQEKILLSLILYKIENHKRRAYFIERLLKLLSTPHDESDKLYSKHKKDLLASINNEKDNSNIDINKEENLISATNVSGWQIMHPTPSDPVVWIYKENPLDIHIQVNIFLNGDPESIREIKFIEDSVEKHLSRLGFNIDLVFQDIYMPNRDFAVTIDHSKWATSYNWTGGTYTIAHELLHLLGLEDEYDLIEIHHDNKYMTWEQRLRLFYHGIDQVLPSDAKQGIMCYNKNKLLQRHICAIVKLNTECTHKRLEKYGK